jgi:hypothetical protein
VSVTQTFSEQRQPAHRYPVLRAAGYSIEAYQHAVALPRVIQGGRAYHLIIPGPDPVLLFASEDRAKVDWIDFNIELVVGLVALITGFKLGREAYEVFRPVINDLTATDEKFRELTEQVGEEAVRKDALSTGKRVRELWAHLWHNHRRTIFRTILKAVGKSLSPRRLLLMLLRWMIRLFSSGAAFLIELGLLIIPLNHKLRNAS